MGHITGVAGSFKPRLDCRNLGAMVAQSAHGLVDSIE